MISHKRLLFVYGLAVHLLIVGIICYTCFSIKPPDEPIRLMYKTAAGKVLFDHSNHKSITGYGISCNDCHHHPCDLDTILSCEECHKSNSTSMKACLDCHELEDIEDIEVFSRSNAFHSQCIQCHKDIEAGPTECYQCHVS